ncbi:hypothetical protein P175DRAFT_0494963 [Aspergillus ochraceoroseus IBT 24754]|uniref:Uncharacterized protein n=1 Tax=Aspergillus ochraceoroseus IBT 24754 TaxID=1392256 RepID=A0A2T5LQM8_9EURO|nr:uncharacterized protein P175DRAFT_0494963 [Aspergillus ochraceoroseus IBT 24754]PTU18594.1 hypothetical protein P175DRAFT_0494963 [Aspergillus ochraceoroseus IBT 24754]
MPFSNYSTTPHHTTPHHTTTLHYTTTQLHNYTTTQLHNYTTTQQHRPRLGGWDGPGLSDRGGWGVPRLGGWDGPGLSDSGGWGGCLGWVVGTGLGYQTAGGGEDLHPSYNIAITTQQHRPRLGGWDGPGLSDSGGWGGSTHIMPRPRLGGWDGPGSSYLRLTCRIRPS